MASKRIPLVAGNWKMNFDHLEATYFVQKLVWLLRDAHFDFKRCEVALFPSFTSLRSVQVLVEADKLHVAYGAQSVSVTTQGAFTGDVSADMIAHLGCSYVIVGHSERRQYFAEGVTEELVRMQTKIALRDVTAEQMANVVIAYEPIWAIGTGKTATADQAEEVCGQIRKVIGEVYGEAVAEATTVQYGGSMNAKNCEELLSKKDVDGGLIGGASLKAPDFAVIVNAATKG